MRPQNASTSAWWLLPTTAKRPPRGTRPATAPERLLRSSCWRSPRRQVRSCSYEPGARSAVAHVVVRSGAGLAQTGRHGRRGTKRTFWRKRGTRCRRDSMWSRNSSWLGGGPSKRIAEATCMCAPARSMWRKEESSPVSRSGTAVIFAQPRGCSGGDRESQLVLLLGGLSPRLRLPLRSLRRGTPSRPHGRGRCAGVERDRGPRGFVCGLSSVC